MREHFLSRSMAVVGSASALWFGAVPRISADTGPVPPQATVQGDLVPRELIVGAIVLAVVVIAVRVPASRRWIAALLVLALTAIVVLAIGFAGTVGGWAGRPMEVWTIPAMVGATAVGLVSAGWVVVRRRAH